MTILEKNRPLCGLEEAGGLALCLEQFFIVRISIDAVAVVDVQQDVKKMLFQLVVVSQRRKDDD